MKRGRINAYLKFQLGDFLILRAGLPTLVAVMFGYMLWKQMSGSIDWTTPQGQGFALQVFQTIASVFITIGSFLGVARIVADHRGGAALVESMRLGNLDAHGISSVDDLERLCTHLLYFT